MNNKHDMNLILGATGKTGRRVVERLQKLVILFRAGSRSARPAFDWEDQRAWAPCLEGIAQVYVTYYPDLCVPGAVETVKSFFAQAVDAGVRKLVLLSGRGEIEAEQAEHAVKASGADWTILRCSFFCQNFSEGSFVDPIIAGEVALPIGSVAEPFVDTNDIADVAVAALTTDRHSGQLLELTGARALSFACAIQEIAFATGRDIGYLEITPEKYRAALVEAHVPEDVIELSLYLFRTVLDGRNQAPCEGVQQALGRPARDFKEYVEETAVTGVWGAR